MQGKYAPRGNRKLGRNVAAINRLPGETCPGASEWCKRECYAKKGTFHFAYPHYLGEIKIPDKMPAICRIHVSGDFDTVDYVDWIHGVVASNPGTLFWAYTRSWTIPELLPALERLRELPNIQLFASTDESMADVPPAGWRIAFITGDNFMGMTCLEQTGRMPNCKACGYCFRKQAGNVGLDAS